MHLYRVDICMCICTVQVAIGDGAASLFTEIPVGMVEDHLLHPGYEAAKRQEI